MDDDGRGVGGDEEEISASIALQFMEPMAMDATLETIPESVINQFDEPMEIDTGTATQKTSVVNTSSSSLPASLTVKCKYARVYTVYSLSESPTL